MSKGNEIKKCFIGAVSRLPGGSWLLRQRFVKFGAVGFSGTLVNLAFLYAGQEFFYRSIASPRLRLNLSLATAIFIATLHNFFWNRVWTWGDLMSQIRKHIAIQFMQYCAACWLAIALQIVFTNFLIQHMHYLPANILAIVITAALNFLINHSWTFRTTYGKDIRR